MKDLFEGARQFSTEGFKRYRDLFERLGGCQTPHTLFIGCSDSRVAPHLLTGSQPGELFIVRNIANMVPYYRESNEYLSTTSAIEYAVKILQVTNLIICGHSNCGGCGSLFADESCQEKQHSKWNNDPLKEIPYTKKWMELAQPVKEQVKQILQERKHHQNSQEFDNERAQLTEKLNIIEQIKHLLTYPYIQEKHETGKLNIYGWYYMIKTGEIYNYDMQLQKFIKIE